MSNNKKFDFGEWFEEKVDVATILLGEKAVLKEFLESIHLVTVGALKGLDLNILPEVTPIALRCALKSAIQDLKTEGNFELEMLLNEKFSFIPFIYYISFSLIRSEFSSRCAFARDGER